MTGILLVGAGGFGREALCWLRDVLPQHPDWSVTGFLDASPTALEGYCKGLPILGDPATWQPEPDQKFICAIGDPNIKRRVCEPLEQRGAAFATIVHPTAVVGCDVRIGDGTVVCPKAVITTDVRIGKCVTVNVGSTIGHDAEVGDWCTLSGHAEVTGFARLQDGVFLGAHAVVLPGITIGSNTKVAAGSVVYRNARSNTTLFGAPAKDLYAKAGGTANASGNTSN